MKQSTSISLSDKDRKRLKELLTVYDLESASELIRLLIEQEYNTVNKYRELNV